jgi:hypothetical protein
MADRSEFRAATVAYLDEQEARLARLVRAALRAAFRPVLDRLAAAPLTAATDPAQVFTPADLTFVRTQWAVEVQGMIVPLVAELFQAGALSAITSIGPQATATLTAPQLAAAVQSNVNQATVDWLQQAENRLVGFGDEAWAAARDTLLEGYSVGDGIPELTGRVQEALDVTEARAETIARTEVISASNAGSYRAAQAYGEQGPATKSWLATLDTRTRESHADADGQSVAMAENFTVGGYELEFPGDPAGPPEEVANCRCTILYDQPDDQIDQTGRQTGGVDDAGDDLTAATEATTMSGTTRARGARFTTQRGTFQVPPPPRRSTAAVDPATGEEEPPAETETDAAITIEVPEGVNVMPFSTIMAVEGRWTGDDRFILPNAIRWDGMLPIPFTVDHEDDVPSVIGLIGRVERVPGPEEGEWLILGWGLMDLGTMERPNTVAQDVVDRLRAGSLRSGSVRFDDETLGGVDPATVADGDDEWWMYVVEDARLRAYSVTPVVAFPESAIFLNPEDIDLETVPLPPAPDNPAVALTREEAQAAQDAAQQAVEDAIDALPDAIGEDVIVLPAAGLPRPTHRLVVRDRSTGPGPGLDMLVARAAPTAAPPGFFADPEFGSYEDDARLCMDPVTAAVGCPFSMSDANDAGIHHVYGHVALWGTCHTGFPDQCVTPPRSASGYASFLTGEYVCADGARLAVGRLTAGTGHASTDRSVTAAMVTAHYDNTGYQGAFVTAGEDHLGIWVAGATAPGLTDEQRTTMLASPISGDWRKIGVGLELLAALHVNAPGFPVPRVRVTDGQTEAMVATGVVGHRFCRKGRTDPGLDAAAQRIAATIGRDRPALLAALQARVDAAAQAARS